MCQPGVGSRSRVRKTVIRHRPAIDAYTQAGAFAQAALRVLLEILDRRRPVAQVDRIAAPTVVAAVRTLVGEDLVPGRRLGTAVLHRVRVHPAGSAAGGKPEFEVCAAYRRGERQFAAAARVKEVRSGQWKVTALRLR